MIDFFLNEKRATKDWGGGPGVVLVLCGFVAFAAGRFMLGIILMFVLVLFRSYLALWSPRLAGMVCVLLLHLFVCLECVNFCRLSLPLGVRGCLRLVIVALPGPFCLLFLYGLGLNARLLYITFFACSLFRDFIFAYLFVDI